MSRTASYIPFGMVEQTTLPHAAIGSLVTMVDLATTIALRTLSAGFTRHVDVFAAFPHSIIEGRVLNECNEALEDTIRHLGNEFFRFARGNPFDIADSWNNMIRSHFGFAYEERIDFWELDLYDTDHSSY